MASTLIRGVRCLRVGGPFSRKARGVGAQKLAPGNSPADSISLLAHRGRRRLVPQSRKRLWARAERIRSRRTCGMVHGSKHGVRQAERGFFARRLGGGPPTGDNACAAVSLLPPGGQPWPP